MKNILVLTDFSTNSAHAARYAYQLAKQLHTGILLYHTVQSIPIVPNYAGGGFVTETESLFAEESREHLTQLRDQLMSGQGEGPMIGVRNGEGDLGDNIRQLLNDEAIELIVMGAPEGSVVEHLLMGSETRAVIRASSRPVLVIPANEQVRPIHKLVLATDYRSEDLCALRYLSNWVANNGGNLDVVHIQTAGEAALLNAQQTQVFEFFLDNLEQTNVHCHDLRGKAIQERLNRFCTEKKVDMLAMINYHHDFFSHLFGTSKTFSALHHLQLPILVFPVSFSDETIGPM